MMSSSLCSHLFPLRSSVTIVYTSWHFTGLSMHYTCASIVTFCLALKHCECGARSNTEQVTDPCEFAFESVDLSNQQWTDHFHPWGHPRINPAKSNSVTTLFFTAKLLFSVQLLPSRLGRCVSLGIMTNYRTEIDSRWPVFIELTHSARSSGRQRVIILRQLVRDVICWGVYQDFCNKWSC